MALHGYGAFRPFHLCICLFGFFLGEGGAGNTSMSVIISRRDLDLLIVMDMV